jgi:hypothetical protein
MRMTHYRWGVVALLFLAVTVNYVDRAVLGVLTLRRASPEYLFAESTPSQALAYW